MCKKEEIKWNNIIKKYRKWLTLIILPRQINKQKNIIQIVHQWDID